jgi:murein DD-endopeptidase MepM/ murein hydrolase activator NlpD
MKPRILLAAVLMLPASVSSAVQAPPPAPPTALAVRAPAATAAGDSAAPARPSWQWPLAPRPPVVRPFDPPPEPWLSGHRGVDLGTPGPGTEVLSPAAGIVSFVGVVVDRPVITIDHGRGLRSSFEPVESGLAAGSTVAAGQVIGTTLPRHCPEPGCVHWGVRQGDDYINPLQFVLDLRPSVLLPLGGPP